MTKEELDKLPAVAIRFTADWCKPCKSFGPAFDKVSDTNTEIPSATVNVDESDLAKDYEVLGIPCVVFLKDGVEIHRINGNQPEQVIQEGFDKLKKEETNE